MRCPAKCRRVGMADDADSKSVGGNTVWVQVPPPAPARRKRHLACDGIFHFIAKLIARPFCCPIPAQEPPPMRLAPKNGKPRQGLAVFTIALLFARRGASWPGRTFTAAAAFPAERRLPFFFTGRPGRRSGGPGSPPCPAWRPGRCRRRGCAACRRGQCLRGRAASRS